MTVVTLPRLSWGDPASPKTALLEQTSAQNDPWDVRTDAARLSIPTHVTGAGRSPHRDLSEATIRHLLEALS